MQFLKGIGGSFDSIKGLIVLSASAVEQLHSAGNCEGQVRSQDKNKNSMSSTLGLWAIYYKYYQVSKHIFFTLSVYGLYVCFQLSFQLVFSTLLVLFLVKHGSSFLYLALFWLGYCLYCLWPTPKIKGREWKILKQGYTF